jgi:hypothetical protein
MSEPDNFDMSAYAQFRAGLLKHIGMEEKILLPQRGEFAAASRFRLAPDCASITAR